MNETLTRIPFSMEAEQSVLGAILINPRAVLDAVSVLRPADFYLPQNAAIFEAVTALFTAGDVVDSVTISEKLRQAGQYDPEQTPQYLLYLAEFTPSSLNTERYARIVYEKSMLRALIEAAQQITENCMAESEEFTLIMEQAEQIVYDLSHGRRLNEMRPIAEVVDEAYTRISELFNGNRELGGTPSGFADLDAKIGGLNRSDLILIAARPGIGKTSLALNIASHVAIKEQKGVAIFSLEMSGEQLVSRMISALALVDSYRLRTGEIRPDEWTRLAEAVSILGDAPVKIDDNAGITVQEIKAKLRREKNIGLVIIDYLQLMRSGIRSDNRAQEVAEISRSLKIMARELDIPVIALSQLNRASESRKDKKPMLSDLRESGSIEQDADIVIFLYRDDDNPDLEARNIVNCSVAKNRHGATGSIDFLWNGQYTRFMTLETRHEPS